MPGWGWFLLGLGAAAVAGVVLWALLRGRSRPDLDRAKLDASAKKRAEADLAAEREARRRAEEVARGLEAELRAIADRKKKRLEAIDETERKDLRDLTDDPDALLARVAEIVGGSDEAVTRTGKVGRD